MTPEAKKTLNSALELRLFGDDLTARNDGEIFQAVHEWLADLSAFSDEYQAVSKHRKKHSNMSGDSNVIAWECRHGQPWQSAIEQHVAAYRREPRDFTTWEGMGLVLNKMASRYCRASIGYDPEDGWHVHFANPVWTKEMYGPDLPSLVARAALSAIESEVVHA